MTTTKPSYGASAALTMTLASLASDTNLLAGRSSAVVDNTSDLGVDVFVSGVIETGTSPTVSTNIEVWAWAILDDTPTYPDAITGSDANVSLTSLNVKTAGAFKLGTLITIDATTNRKYPFLFSLAALFGGTAPKKWGIWIVHNTGVALAASGSTVSKASVVQYTNA